jgi:hypothetical protein
MTIMLDGLRRVFEDGGVQLSEEIYIFNWNVWMVQDRAINLSYWIPKRGMKKEGKMKVFVPEKFKGLSGLGLIRATFGPHYGARREAVQNIMRRTSGVALCVSGASGGCPSALQCLTQ